MNMISIKFSLLALVVLIATMANAQVNTGIVFPAEDTNRNRTATHVSEIKKSKIDEF